MPTPAQLYRDFLKLHTHCWLCGRGPDERPHGWFGPFGLERAHIVSSPRVEDIRAIVAICTCCHRFYHGERLILNGRPYATKRPLRTHLLHLKKIRDPANYDRDFLRRYFAGKLPRASTPPAEFLEQYAMRDQLRRRSA
jgi:hypothetical protein